METGIFEVKFKDGRAYRIFYENRNQKDRFFKSLYKINPLVESWRTITNGIHTVKQWEEQIKFI